jgi:hypothetical protein
MAKRKPAQNRKHEPVSPPLGATNKSAVQPEETSPLFAPPPHSVKPPLELPPNAQLDLLKFKALMESFGITDWHFISPLYTQMMNVDRYGENGLEFAAAVIRGLKPRDQLEAMLGAQMSAMHWATMEFMRQVGGEGKMRYGDQPLTPFQVRVAMATKLARTFAAQMEVFKRYRRGGEQKVTVQHVVEKRDRGIVATVTRTKSRKPVSAEPADEPPLLSDARGSAKPVPGDLAYEEQMWLEYVARQQSSS